MSCALRPTSLLLLATLLAPAGAQSIAYEKFTLPNGMTVILHEDHRLPQVVINTWYRVGAKDEPAGRSGFAHLFEHLMFMGTERVPGSDFDIVMENGGGSNNASTTEDRTNYYSEGPASLLPTLLWLDADRLEDLGRTMTQEKLDKQRDIVRNEIRQNVENTPYGRAGELMYRLLFPAGHPYHNAVYGTHEDLEAATVDDVKSFFATFYVPNNASLVIAGDFDPKQIKPLVEQLFGTLPRGGDVTRRIPAPPRLEQPVRTTVLDKVQLPMLKMAWHSPAGYAPGDAELQLCAAILTDGKSSRLYQRLVMDEQIAVDVSAYQDPLSLDGRFGIDVVAAPGVSLDRLEAAVDAELARLAKEGVTAAELNRRQAAQELRRLSSLQRLGAVADQLNAYEFAWGEPDSFARDLDRFRKVTPQAVQQWAQQVLDPQRRVVLRVLPEQPERSTSPRDQRPAAAATGSFVPPVPESFTLENGVPVHVWTRPELPLVSLQLLFANGRVQNLPATAGLTELTANMLQQGAGDRDAVAFADAVQELGATLSVAADPESAVASLTVLRRNLAAAADLLLDALRRPRLDAADFAREHRLWLEELRQQDDQPQAVAARVAARALYGRENPYGWPSGGTVATVTTLTLAQVQVEHARLFTASAGKILIAGDLTVEAAKALLQPRFGDWSTATPSSAGIPDHTAEPHEGLRIVLVDRPAAVQTVLRFVAPGPRYATPDRMRYQLLNTLLGGSFTSRLNQNLRERNGYTYGAGSGFSMSPFAGSFTASTAVRADVTGAAVKELLFELRRLGAERGDLTAEELGKGQETLRSELVQSFGTLRGILGSANELVLNGMPFSTPAEDLRTLDAITLDELNGFGRKALQIDAGVLVLVGDKATIQKQLEGLGLPPLVECDTFGEPLRR